MQDFLTHNYAKLDVTFKKGNGDLLWDINDKKYIDFSGGIAVNALGHCHPEIIKTLEEQAHQLWHCSNLFYNLPSQELAKKLVEHTFADKVFFANSGGEANEAALKLARKYAYDNGSKTKNKIISCANSFHGRTLFTVTVGGQKKYQTGFEPLPTGIEYVEFNNLNHLEKKIDDDVCAVIIEPIQGEGGVIPARFEFLKFARELCNKYHCALIFDEVQCGMGRIGQLFAYQYYDVTPDILTTAKALGSGIPIGAMLTTNKFAPSFTPGSHGTTLGGNPLACAVASKVFDLINNKQTLQNVREQSQKIISEFNKINLKYPVFKEIRGLGLLLGFVLNDHFKNYVQQFQNKALDNGLILLTAGEETIRIAPSLIINDENLFEGIEKFALTVKWLWDEFYHAPS